MATSICVEERVETHGGANTAMCDVYVCVEIEWRFHCMFFEREHVKDCSEYYILESEEEETQQVIQGTPVFEPQPMTQTMPQSEMERVDRKARKHGKQRQVCRDCGGNRKSKHGQLLQYCKECGSAYCEHGKRRNRCKECADIK